MRVLLVTCLVMFTASCSMIYSGVIVNDYPTSITVDSTSGVKSAPVVRTNETAEVPIFKTQQGTCISITHNSLMKYYQVPAPPEWAKISGIWNVKFGLSVSSKGAFYVGGNGEVQKLPEVPNCNT